MRRYPVERNCKHAVKRERASRSHVTSHRDRCWPESVILILIDHPEIRVISCFDKASQCRSSWELVWQSFSRSEGWSGVWEGPVGNRGTRGTVNLETSKAGMTSNMMNADLEN